MVALLGVVGFFVAFESSKVEDFVFSVVFLVVGGVLGGIAACAQRGRNWARITLTVLGALYVLAALVSGSFGVIATALYVVIAVILFWVGGAQNWYRTYKVGA